jgi:predicted 2-oxoglutarate/Fe(II)-dependent dioxygenase YbiX
VSTIRSLAPGVCVATGFLDPEDCTKVLRTAPKLQWSQAFVGYYRDDALIEKRLNLDERDVEVARIGANIDSILPGYGERVRRAFEEGFALKSLKVDGFVLSRYSPGSHIKPHSDTGVRSTSRILTCVQYFNDDYEGGGLEFPQFELSYRPFPGDLVLFYSEYLHAVRQITSGVRYSMISFGLSSATYRLPSPP